MMWNPYASFTSSHEQHRVPATAHASVTPDRSHAASDWENRGENPEVMQICCSGEPVRIAIPLILRDFLEMGEFLGR